MFGRKRTGSLGSFDEKDSKGRKKFHPKSQKKQLSSSLLIVRNSHVSLSKFDEESFALIQSLYNSDTKEKNKKDLVKMANSWVDTASSLRQSAPFEVSFLFRFKKTFLFYPREKNGKRMKRSSKKTKKNLHGSIEPFFQVLMMPL